MPPILQDSENGILIESGVQKGFPGTKGILGPSSTPKPTNGRRALIPVFGSITFGCYLSLDPRGARNIEACLLH